MVIGGQFFNTSTRNHDMVPQWRFLADRAVVRYVSE
jgi:hypothetical protein